MRLYPIHDTNAWLPPLTEQGEQMSHALIGVCEKVARRIRLPVYYLPTHELVDQNGEPVYGQISTNDTPAPFDRPLCLNGDLDIRLIAYTFAHELGHYYDPELNYFSSSQSIEGRYEDDPSACEMVAEGVSVLLASYFGLLFDHPDSQIPGDWVDAYFDTMHGAPGGFTYFSSQDHLQGRADAAARKIMLWYDRQPGDQVFFDWLHNIRAAEGRQHLGKGPGEMLAEKAIGALGRLWRRKRG